MNIYLVKAKLRKDVMQTQRNESRANELCDMTVSRDQDHCCQQFSLLHFALTPYGKGTRNIRAVVAYNNNIERIFSNKSCSSHPHNAKLNSIEKLCARIRRGIGSQCNAMAMKCKHDRRTVQVHADPATFPPPSFFFSLYLNGKLLVATQV